MPTDNSDPRDYILDLTTAAPTPPSKVSEPRTQNSELSSPARGDTLAIHFTCCNVYHRIPLTRDRTAYAGHCPKCARSLRILIDPACPNTGRFFQAG